MRYFFVLFLMFFSLLRSVFLSLPSFSCNNFHLSPLHPSFRLSITPPTPHPPFLRLSPLFCPYLLLFNTNNEVKGENLGNDTTLNVHFSDVFSFVSFYANRCDELRMKTVGGLVHVRLNLMQTSTTGERYQAYILEECEFQLMIHHCRRR